MIVQLLLSLAAGTVNAQEPTIRVDVQQVLVPVIVTDKKGHHVTGLHGSDFRILEDGVPQEIASFTTDTAGSAGDPGALAKPAEKASRPRHTFVISIDTLHASPANAARMRQTLQNLFETEKPAGAQYVLIGIGRQLQVLQPATTNPLEVVLKIKSAAFQSAMAGLDAAALSAQLQNIRRRMDEFCKHCACGARSAAGNCDSEIDTLKQDVDAEAERWAAPSRGLIEQFKSVVEELAKLPTGRTLVLVSEGFNLDPRREFYASVAAYLPNQPQFKLDNSASDPTLLASLQAAAGRNVTIDAIDSRGVVSAGLSGGGSMDASEPASRGTGTDLLGTNRPSRAAGITGSVRSDTDPRSRPSASQESANMEQLARATGGVYSKSSSDLLKDFRSALADGREYYILAYVPKNGARDGKFRTITVETKDPKLTIRAKRGYWADGAAQ
jgi:VWFA-related protein